MDPYAVGYLSGPTVVLAVLGYFIGRKLVGPSGVGEVERLKQRAGISEPGTKPPSRLLGFVPYLLAVGGAMAGLIFGVVSLATERKALVHDRIKFEEGGFLSSCERSCVAANSDSHVCPSFCACVLGELKREHPTPESLMNFLRADDKDPVAEREFQNAQARCQPNRATSK